jgi:type IV pilus assembly protein PilN
MIRINLLPVRAAQKKEKLRSHLSLLFLSIVLAFAICGALYVQQMFAIDNIKEEIATIDKKNADLKKTLGEVTNYEKKKQDLEQKLAVLQQLEDGRTGPVRLLDELSTALPTLPDKVWLSKFSESGGTITLEGIGDSERSVARFMQNLDASPYYRNIELSETKQAKVAELKMQKFSLKCQADSPSAKP